MGQTLDNFNPLFVAAYNALNAHCGGGASVGSGYRTTEEQAGLLWKRSQGISVADPGTSRHEGHHGGAIDLNFASEETKACMHENANAYGLGFDVPGEDWHIQLSAEGEQAIEDGTFAELFGIGEEPTAPEAAAPPESPLSRLRDRFFGEAEIGLEGGAPGRLAPEPTVPAAGTPVAATSTTATTDEEFTPAHSAGYTAGPAERKMSGADVAKVYAQAGFTGEALVTMVAIAKGESGWDSGAAGDTGITTGTWGPSMGLSQIRSLNAERGTGGWRDPNLLNDPVFNARAAYAISNGGTNFTPWTVYSSGDWKSYTTDAKTAVAALGPGAYQPAGAPPAASVSPTDDMGLGFDPVDPMDSISDIAERVLAGRREERGEGTEVAERVLAEKGETSPLERIATDEAEENAAEATRSLGEHDEVGGF